jgi:NAD(P)-dependent dehydrogenase (short-subunit alcohol dehydrogenase family)
MTDCTLNTALVLGASGGIGAALAAALEGRGLAVTRLSRRHGGPDLRDPQATDRALAALPGPFAQIWVATGILAPAGRRPEKALREIDAQALSEVLAVNTIGPALVLRHAPRLLPRRDRSLLAVLSARVGSIGDNELGGWHAYRASKAALNMLLKGAAIELARTHPQAVAAALHPGTVDSPFTAGFDPAHGKLAPEEAARRLLAATDALTPADSGTFLDHRGRTVPW